MKDSTVRSLIKEVRRLKKNYSRPASERPNNVMNETYHFTRNSITVLGERMASVVFDKTRDGTATTQQALCVLIQINYQGGNWLHIFPGYDHLYGWEVVKQQLHDVEQHNLQSLFAAFDPEDEEDETQADLFEEGNDNASKDD